MQDITLYQHQSAVVDWQDESFQTLPFTQARFGLFYAPRTGKTFILLAMAQKFGVQCLIVVPKGLKAQWEEHATMFGGNHQVITKETFRRDHQKLPRYDAIIIDECHHMANIQSKLTKSMLWYLREHNPTYRWPATGTPYRSSAMNIYAIGQILGKNWNYWSYFTQFFTQVNMGPRKVPMARKGPHIDALLEDYIKSIGITLAIEAVYDMPLQHKHTEQFELTQEQKKACTDLSEPVNIARFTKLHSIENGFLYGDGYTEDQTFPSKKTSRILELASQHKKIAIVCRYTQQIELYKSLLAEQPLDTAAPRPIYIISGTTKDRAQSVKDIEASDACVVLVQAQCSEGFSLASIDTMVFASLSFSHVDHIQMLARIVNLTKTRENNYYYLISGDIDNSVYKAIMREQDFHMALYA